MRTHVYEDHARVSQAFAECIADWINENPDALICLSAGDTPLEAYRRLIEMQRTGAVDLGSVYYVGLDEWVGLGIKDRGSCAKVMTEAFYAPADIPADRIAYFDGLAEPQSECNRIGNWIRQRGGIGLITLGIGMNGHVAFNEPHAIGSETALCHVAPIAEVTANVSVKYFGKACAATQGVTISLPTIQRAKHIALIATGVKKASVVEQLFSVAEPTPAFPVSLLRDHCGATLYLDSAAAASTTLP